MPICDCRRIVIQRDDPEAMAIAIGGRTVGAQLRRDHDGASGVVAGGVVACMQLGRL